MASRDACAHRETSASNLLRQEPNVHRFLGRLKESRQVNLPARAGPFASPLLCMLLDNLSHLFKRWFVMRLSCSNLCQISLAGFLIRDGILGPQIKITVQSNAATVSVAARMNRLAYARMALLFRLCFLLLCWIIVDRRHDWVAKRFAP